MRCRQLVLSWEKKLKKGSAGQNVANFFFLLYENENKKEKKKQEKS